jgi:hypothetical protein
VYWNSPGGLVLHKSRELTGEESTESCGYYAKVVKFNTVLHLAYADQTELTPLHCIPAEVHIAKLLRTRSFHSISR